MTLLQHLLDGHHDLKASGNQTHSYNGQDLSL